MYSLISKLASRGVQSAVKQVTKQVTMTATQKTVATVASKAAIATATTAGSVVINKMIQEKEATKIAKDIDDSVTAVENGESDTLISEEEAVKRAKKAQTKANVASGAVIGVGTVASTLVDIGFKSL